MKRSVTRFILGVLYLALSGCLLHPPSDDPGYPSKCPGQTDTEKVQYALDHFPRVHFDRDYVVTSVTIHRVGQYVDFCGHVLHGSKADAEACLFVRGRELNLRNIHVNANFGYQAAVRWDSVHPSKPAQYNKVFGMHIRKAKVGLLFGAFSDPVDAPQSENAIFGLTFRCVQTCVKVNQPNGFFYIANSVLDCNPFEWSIERPEMFDDIAARVLCVDMGQVEVVNSELLKTATQNGYMIEVNRHGTLKLANCHFETGATAFLVGGNLRAVNLSGLTNSDSAPAFEVSLGADAGLAALTNCDFHRKLVVSAYSAMPLIRAVAETRLRFAMVNCEIVGWRSERLSSPNVRTFGTNLLFRFQDASGPAEYFLERSPDESARLGRARAAPQGQLTDR